MPENTPANGKTPAEPPRVSAYAAAQLAALSPDVPGQASNLARGMANTQRRRGCSDRDQSSSRPGQ